MRNQSTLSAVAFSLVTATAYSQGIITTIAGTGRVFPSGPLPAINAPVGPTAGVAVDSAGNVYLADAGYSLVMRVAPDGTLTVVAGNGLSGFSGEGGPATSASLFYLSGVTVDSAGNLYIADQSNRVRKVAGGTITTVAGNGTLGFSGDGGPALSARLADPTGMAVDSAGNLYIADTVNSLVRKVTPGGMITHVAGDGEGTFSGDGGPATAAGLGQPYGVAVDGAGNLYITAANRVRKVTPDGIITTVAGGGTPASGNGDGGPATQAILFAPMALAVDAAGNLYIGESVNNRVRKVTTDGTITTIAGTGTSGFSGDGGLAINAQMAGEAAGLAVDQAGNLYIADMGNDRIRKVAPNGIITTFAGNGSFSYSGDGGPAAAAQFNPTGSYGQGHVGLGTGGSLYIADAGNNRIRKVAASGTITTVAGSGIPAFSGDGGPATSAGLSSPTAVVADQAGNLYIADTGNSRIRKVSTAGTITTLAQISGVGLALDAAANLYVADSNHYGVWKVAPNGTTKMVAGNGTFGYSGDGGPATAAGLTFSSGVAVDAAGNLYIADYLRIRKVTPDGTISTVAGNGKTGFTSNCPSAVISVEDVAVDATGNLYFADAFGNCVRKVTNGVISVVAGGGNPASGIGDGGPATGATLYFPSGVAVDAGGNLFIVDSNDDRIREVPAAAAAFQASPLTLSFSAKAGGAAGSAQTVNLSSSLAGLAFSASASASWLSVTPANGSLPASLQVSADASQLTAGNYTASITITAPNAAPPTAAIAVNITVQPGGAPVLSIDGLSLSFGGTQGGGSLSKQVHVSNTGTGSLAFTVSSSTSSGGPWLSVSPSSGAATPSSPVTLNIGANIGSLAAGTYSGSIVISVAGENTVTVPVTLSVAAVNRVILLSQTGLTFRAVAQGGTPLPQTFGILNTGQGSMDWTATATPLSGGNWLSISPSSGTVSQPYLDVSLVTVAVNAAGLAPGDYYGGIQVTAAAVDSPQSVTVILTVLPPGSSPGPEVQPTGLIFTGTAGQTPGSQTVLIGNPQGQMDHYQSGIIPTAGAGFTILPTNAQVAPNQPTTLNVYPDFTQLQPGTIQPGVITLLFDDGAFRNISVLTVVAPSVVSGSSLRPDAATTCSPLQVQPTSLTDATATVTKGKAATIAVKVVDHCGSAVNYPSTVVASFSNGDPVVSLAPLGNGAWSGTWTPANTAQSQVTIQINALSFQGTQSASGAKSISVLLQTGGAPLTTSVQNAASQVSAFISPGGLVAIYGQQLSDQVGQPGSVPFPTQFNGTQVLMGGKLLPLQYVGPAQVNAQVPFDLGINTAQQLIVQVGNTLSVPQNVVVAAAQPAVYTRDQEGVYGSQVGVIVNSNTFALITPSNPAHAGDIVVIYCNGLGAVNPPIPAGTPAPAAGPLSHTVNPLTVTVGGVNAQVNFAGLSPGFAGVFQVNAVVPAGVAPGDGVPVVLSIAGQASPPVSMSVR